MAQQSSIWNRLSVWMCSFMHSCLIVLPWASLFSHIRSSLLHFLGLHCSHYSRPHWDMSHLGRLQEKSSDAQECVRFTENWVSKSTTTGQLFGGMCCRKSWHFQLLPSMTKHDFRKTVQEHKRGIARFCENHASSYLAKVENVKHVLTSIVVQFQNKWLT